ncbi:NAD(P)-binding protein [Teratosphaeria nubilosa]|uniref:2,4-dienoyl-CoA reductase [(3E)-enoyl-CoA-producing] n=1 Tax=Teratosphaeria nubilosa TaxID=161662 RepID=A0A6G1L0X4_9PEZI|nr:NAD(P)-binding protein [Teratosphaeria nubilosa]
MASVRPGSKVIGVVADVRDAKGMVQAAEQCVKELGSLDFAIAGAAGNFLAPFSQLSSNAFKTVVEIDTLGSFNTAKAVLPHLVASAKKYGNDGSLNKAGTGGRIIFISATFSQTGKVLQAHAAAAKAAVDQISHSIAIEYGPHGVTSNIITPGPIAGTEGMERLAKSDPESAKKNRGMVPVGRYGETREIADATVYLFADTGSYVNGANLIVDGGEWRTSGAAMGGSFPYPEFFMSGAEVTGVKTGRKAKL